MMKRQNKTKEELARELKNKENVKRQKALARLIFPFVEKLDTAWDAQTVFNAVAGHIKYGLIKKENELKVSDLFIDLEKGKGSKVKQAVTHILKLIEPEQANDTLKLLELMGSKLPEFIATKELQKKMTVTADEFIAD